jgi:hypothetical protein
MKNKTTKCRTYLTIDREEQFLNEMCQKGWKPIKIILGMFFKFERCEPGEYTARVTTSMKLGSAAANKQKREQMIEFLTDSGAEIIPESLNVDTKTRIYTVRKSSLGEFEINTDIESLIADYTARRKYHITWIIIALVLAVFGTLLGTLMAVVDGYVGKSAWLEFTGVMLEVFCALMFAIPIPKYSRKIKELTEEREINE